MDSEYIRQNEIHEKYVLNQLDEKEKAEYEAFLKSNPQAQKEMEETRNLIQGVRAVGKDSFKKEISRQVEDLRRPKTDWSVLYKAAAVLFIFVLVPSVIYYQMKEPAETHPEIQTIEAMTQKQDLGATNESEKAEEPESIIVNDEDKMITEQEKAPQPVQQKSSARASGMAGSGYKSENVIDEKDKSPAYENEMSDLKTAPSKSFQANSPRLKTGLSAASLPEQKATRTLVFSKFKPPVELVLFRIMQKEVYPQKLDLHITDDEEMFSINLAVSPTIFLMKDVQIKVNLNPENNWLITFADTISYKLNLNADPPFAQKIKKK